MPINLRVKNVVLWNDTSHHLKVFFYCLHCHKIFCRSGLFYHKETFIATRETRRELAEDFLNNQERHQIHVRRQFEKRLVRGRMVGGVIAETYPDDHFTPMNPQRDSPRQSSVRRLNLPVPTREQNEIPFEQFEPQQHIQNENEDVINNHFPELFDCFHEMDLTRIHSKTLPEIS